jgi:hypothetical protein
MRVKISSAENKVDENIIEEKSQDTIDKIIHKDSPAESINLPSLSKNASKVSIDSSDPELVFLIKVLDIMKKKHKVT